MKTTIDMKHDPVLNGIVADRAASFFEQRFRNLLVCFDAGSVFSAIASFLRLQEPLNEENFTVPAVVERTEEAFRQLLQRGALNQFQRIPSPIPELAQKELDTLFGATEEDVEDEQSALVSQHQVQVEQCAKDWRALPTADFKRKWPARDHESTIQEAWALLENQDKSTANGYKTQRESREREANAALPRTF